MEGTTEPIIAVIGHPIAGNPSQFAVERSLRSLQLEWRVLSFDVAPDDVEVALEGFRVTGIIGVLVDASVQSQAAQWYAGQGRLVGDEPSSEQELGDDQVVESERQQPTIPLTRVDCLFRGADHRLVGTHEHRNWFQRRLRDVEDKRIWLGDRIDQLHLTCEQCGDALLKLPPDPELIESARLIVLTDQTGHGTLDMEDWPEDDGSTLVIDFSGDELVGPALQRLGYTVESEWDQRIATLQRCIERWTERTVSADIIRDAIEEYLGV